MFKNGEKIRTLTSSGATNFRNSKLEFNNKIIKVVNSIQGYLFESYFHLFNWFVCITMSLDMMSDPLLYERNEMTFGVLAFGMLFSFLVRLGFGLRAKVKSFDLDSGLFYVANSFKSYPGIPITQIEKLYSIYSSRSGSNGNSGYEFTLKTKSGDIHLIMNHSDSYCLNNEVKKLASTLGIPYEILREGEIYKDPILE
tara:strand:- start:55 stop:648 length:594 start_codon:yes stop_codon:yes gene_type:complete